MFLEDPFQVFQRSGLARVIGCEGWASEALAEDFVPGAQSVGVVGGGEEVALDLGGGR